mmetsp:Transcript_137211/g.293142  ORF Transcript_137211/g.293142 Transcript_137211/m.293142 type:complete len:83 (-) Transcript_137211:60-308(-)
MLGVPAAFLSFGLSIPFAAAVGSGAGLCAGAFAGGSTGFVGGAALGGGLLLRAELREREVKKRQPWRGEGESAEHPSLHSTG